MPWILQKCLGHQPVLAHSAGSSPVLQRVYRDTPGYTYVNSNRYSYCRKTVAVGGESKGYCTHSIFLLFLVPSWDGQFGCQVPHQLPQQQV
jgi:hypothetical protein